VRQINAVREVNADAPELGEHRFGLDALRDGDLRDQQVDAPAAPSGESVSVLRVWGFDITGNGAVARGVETRGGYRAAAAGLVAAAALEGFTGAGEPDPTMTGMEKV